MAQLGKFSTDRDNILHFLCTSEWSTGSFGDVEAPTGYVWRISNDWEDVHHANTEFNSLIEDQVVTYDIEDTPAFRNSLAGHFLLQEDSNGFVQVTEFPTVEALNERYTELSKAYDEWYDED